MGTGPLMRSRRGRVVGRNGEDENETTTDGRDGWFVADGVRGGAADGAERAGADETESGGVFVSGSVQGCGGDGFSEVH